MKITLEDIKNIDCNIQEEFTNKIAILYNNKLERLLRNLISEQGYDFVSDLDFYYFLEKRVTRVKVEDYSFFILDYGKEKPFQLLSINDTPIVRQTKDNTFEVIVATSDKKLTLK